ncbi:helix-turn-helix domain-containing protein [Rhizobium leguminosarum]|uniref:helix-turn-helix domain-containing protein n=1 Tax=Rhizobium leguminosarum TaxID=384 RepID=UPI000FEC6669|nr:helix-turn-helix transcriptional regulator [Rhizobium leguminosarum]RWX36714.1 XRE family transcriptional regulator [Rhizobium leguminosarum]
MKFYAPPDALRAARALSRLSQHELSKNIQVTRQSISAAENDASAPFPTVSKMRSFYEDQGLQFVGVIDIDSGTINAAGVRWRLPETFPPAQTEATKYHAEQHGTAFVAARSLLGASRADVANNAEMSLKDLSALEAGGTYSGDEYHRLRAYYIKAGIEFMGTGDVGTGLYYGVGVRWASTPATG